MGEAKRRQQSDPSFGRSPKKASYRGIVISPPIEISGTSLHIKNSELDPLELRFSLLFWDRLVWPSSRAIHIASGQDASFLESEGILSRPEYTFYGDMAQGMAKSQIQAFIERDQSEPGIWSLAQGENSLLLREGLFDRDIGALVELNRAIPIPKQDIPIPEILEFKLRRRAELLAFRNHIETMIGQIERADDKREALQNCILEIDQACANLLRVGREWQFPIYLSNLRTSFSLKPNELLEAMAKGWEIGKPYGLEAATATSAITGIASAIEIKADIGFRSIKRPISPYRYAYIIERELI